MGKKKIIVVMTVIIAVTLGGMYFTNSNVLKEKVYISGTLDSVNTACFADGVCTASIEGQTIILLQGWSTNTVGEVRFADGIGGLEQHIGKPVSAYVAKTKDGYTLYGSEDYYIEPAF